MRSLAWPMMGCTNSPVSGAASQRMGIWSASRAEVLVDGGHVRHLQSPAELNAEEAEAHIPDLPERAGGLLHIDGTVHQGRARQQGLKPTFLGDENAGLKPGSSTASMRCVGLSGGRVRRGVRRGAESAGF